MKYIVYHGTNAKFNRFDNKYLGIGNDALGIGFYFAETTFQASHYGKNLMKCEITLNKPIILAEGKNEIHQRDVKLKMSLKQTIEILKKHPDIYDENETPLWNILDISDMDIEDAIEVVARKYQGKYLAINMDLFPSNDLEYREALRDVLGYDGILQHTPYGDIYVCWFPEQIKILEINSEITEVNHLLENILEQDNFRKWFGKSVVVDEKGEPLVCIHRTNADFDSFDIKKSSYNNLLGRGISFVTKNSDTESMKAYGNKTLECYLKIENPFDLDKVYSKDFFKGWFSDEVIDSVWQSVKNILGKDELTGYDFLLYLGYGRGKLIDLEDFMNVYQKFQEHGFDGFVSDNKTMWTCFKGSQVKSVKNNGAWSASDKIYEETVYHGGATKEETDGLKYYAFDKKYIKLFHPNAKITTHKINPKNTFDYANPEHVQMLLDKLPEKIIIKDNYRKHEKTYTKEHFKKLLEGDNHSFGNWNLLEDKDIQQIIRDLGFDSIYLLEYSFSGKEFKNIAMFESLNNKIIAYHGGNLDKGIHKGRLFFTDDINTAKLYGREGRPDYKIYKCELTFKNPLILSDDEYDEYMQNMESWNEPLQRGYDAIICKAQPEFNDPDYYIALDPVKQVKIIEEIKENLLEDVTSLDMFKYEKNVSEFTDELLSMGKVANPSNPYDWVADKMELMSTWNKKDWEFLFKKKLSFQDVRGAQTTFEKISKEIRKLADAYEESKKFGKIQEKFEELKDGIYATQSAYDILNMFKNKPKAYRVVYDMNNRYYFIGDALKYIHGDLISAAYDLGFYYDELKNNSRSEVMIYLGNCLEYKEVLMLSFFPKGFGEEKAIDDERSSDWYSHKYVYDFGTIYTQEACPLEDFDFYQLLGEPLKTEELELPESLNEQKAYHGTHAKFDKFDMDKIKDWRYGYGIYLTRSKGYAANYGEIKEYEVPDDEYLLSWEDSYDYQSEKVQEALYQIWKDAKNQNKHEEIEKAIFGDFANDGEAIYYAISEGLKLSGKATSELLYKYGIKGIDSFKGDCIVVFNPDDVKKLDTIKAVSEELERFI